MIIHTTHWKEQLRKRKEITDDLLELCILTSKIIPDRLERNTWNAIAPIPPSGRRLKIVYTRQGKDIKIATAYWLR
ncbi:MAG: hypothetical protein QF486_01780 [Candidatus Woesearchaeota archaeon]|nr:hypothetical protein [Candidatus Woesearchaeota archaeon]MDP7181057.1 hypothetical protein [Candidatus Woesearchaeota archaeon]MDP7198322.1 hypothetical protein [Candidatus Woesearchaeota archaeon]MDP7467424.1 hypothetical protein [Candidatus Woesearchaeota archaeon]MDP7647651.1 hypothetical protein [Candidatus Woesearchaeota archaeon]